MDIPQENLKRANINEKNVTNSMVTNINGEYNQVAQKMNEYIKNNDEIERLYKAEERRLIETNNNIFSQTDEGRVKFIKELENTASNLRKDCEKLQSLINEKKLFFQFLSSSENEDNKKYSCLNNKNIENELQNEINDNSFKKLMDDLKLDFERKVSLKLEELKDYYDEKNGTKVIPPVYIPPKPFSLEQASEKKPENLNYYEIHSIHYNMGLSETDIQLINNLIAVQCLKEEYPKEFFIDYVFEEIELANINDDYNEKESLELKRIEQNKKFHNSMAVTTDFVAKNIAKIFDISSSEDINMLCKYLNSISKKNYSQLKNALNTQLTGYRYRQYEEDEKVKYDEQLRKTFENKEELLKKEGKGEIIHIAELNYFLKMNNIIIQSDLYYYMLSIMKISKKERLLINDDLNPLKNLHLYELYLTPLIDILSQKKE
jgi:hypothetical protein